MKYEAHQAFRACSDCPWPISILWLRYSKECGDDANPTSPPKVVSLKRLSEWIEIGVVVEWIHAFGFL